MPRRYPIPQARNRSRAVDSRATPCDELAAQHGATWTAENVGGVVVTLPVLSHRSGKRQAARLGLVKCVLVIGAVVGPWAIAGVAPASAQVGGLEGLLR